MFWCTISAQFGMYSNFPYHIVAHHRNHPKMWIYLTRISITLKSHNEIIYVYIFWTKRECHTKFISCPEEHWHFWKLGHEGGFPLERGQWQASFAFWNGCGRLCFGQLCQVWWSVQIWNLISHTTFLDIANERKETSAFDHGERGIWEYKIPQPNLKQPNPWQSIPRQLNCAVTKPKHNSKFSHTGATSPQEFQLQEASESLISQLQSARRQYAEDLR